ncbi:FAD/NAD(P)-binding domain-containing protein [Paxillus ammoniavirescens]|nr:FAD/NAD(P)-binding domain-containing protein [Paxillus ammoniavirescens]
MLTNYAYLIEIAEAKFAFQLVRITTSTGASTSPIVLFDISSTIFSPWYSVPKQAAVFGSVEVAVHNGSFTVISITNQTERSLISIGYLTHEHELRPIPTATPTLQRLGVQDPTGISAADVATVWFQEFSSTVASSHIAGILDLSLDDGFWKDILALTWDLRTVEGRDTIKNLLDNRLIPTGFTRPRDPALFPDLVLLRLCFEFGTKVGKGTAVCYLAPVPGSKWKAYSLFTCLDSLNNFPEQIGSLRKRTVEHGTWEEGRRQEVELVNGNPTVIVIGAGHTGLEIAARLKYIRIAHLVVDKNARIGDSWRGRYKALCLHDTVWYNQTPYLQFPPTWPVYSPATKLAGWLEGYASFLELNVWTSSTVTKAEWNDETKTWTSDLKGEMVHSAQFTSGENYVGKKATVVGACNSGHDVAQDFFNHGVDITMYQRSSTFVVSATAVAELFGAYFKDGFPTDLADIYSSSLPNAVLRRINQRTVPYTAQTTDKAILDGLAKVGFKTNLGAYGAGVIPALYERSGGFYMDTGTSQHIINGDIKIKSGSSIERLTETGLKFADGSELEADVIVFATGYGDPRDSMRGICGPEVADKVLPIWCMDGEGESSGVWRNCGQDDLWFGVEIAAIKPGMFKRSEVTF